MCLVIRILSFVSNFDIRISNLTINVGWSEDTQTLMLESLALGSASRKV